MDAIPTGPAAGNLNKNKTCYKCQQEGHVSNLSQSAQPFVTFNSQIARDCPENADFAG